MTAAPPKRSVPRYVFSGHAIGAAAHFRRLDSATGLNHLVPSQAASVLPPTGGLSQSSSADYSYRVQDPRPRTLFSVAKASSSAAGRCLEDDNKYETEVQVDLEGVEVVEKLRIGLARLHLLSTFTMGSDEPVVTTTGSRVESLSLGLVKAKIEWDDEPLCACGTHSQLAKYYSAKDDNYRQKYAWRFATPAGAPEMAAHGPHYKFSIVRGIELAGEEKDKQDISTDGYTITWKGFGRIILGEIHVKGNDRQLTMVRLAMGSDAGGSGSVGSGQSNGAVATS